MNDLPGEKGTGCVHLKKKEEEERNPPNSVVADCIAHLIRTNLHFKPC